MLGWLWKWLTTDTGVRTEEERVAELAPEADTFTRVDPVVYKTGRKKIKVKKVLRKAKR
jgi:hypothetical protein